MKDSANSKIWGQLHPCFHKAREFFPEHKITELLKDETLYGNNK